MILPHHGVGVVALRLPRGDAVRAPLRGAVVVAARALRPHGVAVVARALHRPGDAARARPHLHAAAVVAVVAVVAGIVVDIVATIAAVTAVGDVVKYLTIPKDRELDRIDHHDNKYP